MEKLFYNCPELELVEFAIECGFADSIPGGGLEGTREEEW